VGERRVCRRAVAGGPAVLVPEVVAVLRNHFILLEFAEPNLLTSQGRVAQLTQAFLVLSQDLAVLDVHVVKIAFGSRLSELVHELHDDGNLMKGSPSSIGPIRVARRAKTVDLPSHLTRPLPE